MDLDPAAVDAFLTDLQGRICAALEAEDGEARFAGEAFSAPGGSAARPRVLTRAGRCV
jgi:coproporphyrinogen III oxidase